MKITSGARAVGHVDMIDMIRGFAALTVAFYHAREILWVGMRDFMQHDPQVSLTSVLSYLTFPFVWGGVGVPIFFVVSGYVIHRRSARDLAIGRSPEFSPRSFLWRRFVRIYPTLFAALLLTFFCDLVSHHFVPQNAKLGDESLSAFSWNVLALQGIVGPAYGSNGPLWTLALEIQFYAVYPLALLIRRRIDSERMLLLALAVSVLGALTLEVQGIVAFPAYYVSWWLGAYVADREAQGKELIAGWPVWAAISIAIGCALVLMHFAGFGAHIAWALGFAFILAKILRIQNTGYYSFAGRPLAVVGGFSYSLYAIHVPLTVMISSVLFHGDRQASILVTILSFCSVVGVAYVFYLVAERPSILWLSGKSSTGLMRQQV